MSPLFHRYWRPWPVLILYSSITGFLMEGALLPFHWLSDCCRGENASTSIISSVVFSCSDTGRLCWMRELSFVTADVPRVRAIEDIWSVRLTADTSWHSLPSAVPLAICCRRKVCPSWMACSVVWIFKIIQHQFQPRLCYLMWAITELNFTSICLSVCLSVCMHISATTCPNFTKFSTHVYCGRSLVLL